MDENGTGTAVTVDAAARDVAVTLPDEKLSEMRRRMRRAERLIGQMAGLQQAITRELCELSSEIGYTFRASGLASSRVEIIDGNGSGDEEDSVTQTEEALQAAAGVSPDFASAALSVEEEYSLATATPEVAFVPWGLMTTTLRGLARYAAIEVSSNEPVGTFDPGTTWNRFSDPISITNRGGLLPDRIQINSPQLKALLRQRFGDDETTLSAQAAIPLILLRPFKMLFYHEKSITAFLDGAENSNDSEAPISELRVLASVMESTLRPCKESLETVADTAAFSDLWYIFLPGSPVYVENSDFAQKVWCVVQRTGGRRYLKRPDHIPASAFKYQTSPFTIDCYFIDFDGRHYVPVYGRFEVLPYHGVRTLASLSAFPLRIALKNGLADREGLISRGKEFMSYTKSVAHRYYDGWGHTRTPDGRKPFPEFEEKFDGEVIIDFGLTLEQRPDWRPSGEKPGLYEMDRSELGGPSHNIDQDWVYDKRFSDRVVTRLKETLISLQEQQAPPDEELLLLLPDRVLGFVLRNRKFASLRIGASPEGPWPLMHIKHEEDPWSKLYSPQGHQEMIQSLVAQHTRDTEPLTDGQDLIRGKECAASSTKRPLFPMTCADLGTIPQDVESTLEHNFHLARSWGCILLLDEADTFLSTRTKGDLGPSFKTDTKPVFLRVLEYYTGILFLTTNRVGDFDEAFASRIHISLYYPRLDLTGTRTIWKNNIGRVRERTVLSDLVVDEEDLLQYAEELYSRQKNDGNTWNGREIRNTFQSALALAEFGLKPGSAVSLTRDHFENIYRSFKEFKSYAQKLNSSSRTDMTRALEKVKSPAELPDIGLDGGSRDTGHRPGSISSSSEISDSDGYPRHPPWQHHQPQSSVPAEAATANQRQQFPYHAQQQVWPLPQGEAFSSPPIFYYPTGTFGIPPFPPFQAMGQPSGLHPKAFVGPPGAYPPIAMESTRGGRGLHPVYGPQLVANLPQASISANEPFDWLGERTQNMINPSSGAGPGALDMGYSSTGKGERKRKRRGPILRSPF